MKIEIGSIVDGSAATIRLGDYTIAIEERDTTGDEVGDRILVVEVKRGKRTISRTEHATKFTS